MPKRHCLPCSVKYMKFRSKKFLQYFEMSERPLATHPKNEMLQCIISLCKNYWYSVFEALTCHSSDNSNGSNRCCSTFFFYVVDVDAFMSCSSSAVVMRAVNTLPLLSFPLSSPISLLAALPCPADEFWLLSPALLLSLLLLMVFKFMLMVILMLWLVESLGISWSVINYCPTIIGFCSVLKFSRIC